MSKEHESAGRTTKLSTQPYKGTRDFYPEDLKVRRWTFERLRICLQSMGYQEYDGPMIEPLELYAAKTSDEIVRDQLYHMTDRGGRQIAVRPEMTPTLARMVAGKVHELPKPIRWFSLPNLWRYERPQKGRLREHWQLNVDLFGGEASAEDLEILLVITEIMAAFGATADKGLYEVRLNHRKLSDRLFRNYIGLEDGQHQKFGQLLDAAPKMEREKFIAALQEISLTENQIERSISLLNAASLEQVFAEHLADQPEFQALKKTLGILEKLGVASVFRFDPSIMRGFMYYTGMVFEVFDCHPENRRALFGGGRYDNLVGMFGGPALSGIGFGMGDVTFGHFLEGHGLLPKFDEKKGVYICALDSACLEESQNLARKMRCALGMGYTVVAALSVEKLRKGFVTAERLGLRHIVFLGPDDLAKGIYPMKDMVEGTQKSGAPEELAKLLLEAP